MTPIVPDLAEVRRVVTEFALPLQHCPEWQRPFELARRLRGLGFTEAEQCREAVQLYCEVREEQFLDVFSALLEAWPKIRFPATSGDEDAFEWALRQAQTDPIPTPVLPPTPEYGLIASVAWHLGVRNHPEPFLLPVKRIAAAVGCQKQTASNIVGWLKRTGVVVCVDETYAFGNGRGRCKKYALADGITGTKSLSDKGARVR